MIYGDLIYYQDQYFPNQIVTSVNLPIGFIELYMYNIKICSKKNKQITNETEQTNKTTQHNKHNKTTQKQNKQTKNKNKTKKLLPRFHFYSLLRYAESKDNNHIHFLFNEKQPNKIQPLENYNVNSTC